MPIQIFLNLTLALAGGGLVNRHLDQVIAAGHDLAHQRGVLG